MGQHALKGGAGKPMLLGDGAGPAARSSALIGSAAKAASSVSTAKRPVHLGGALAQRLGQAGIFGEQHAHLVVLAGPFDGLLLKEALQPATVKFQPSP
jgi:hypothetical protein